MADAYFTKEEATKRLIEYFQCSHISESFIRAVVEQIPAADVRPVVRGKWIHKPGRDGEWICDQCSHELEFIDGRTFGMPNYCPNCGAAMREEIK